MIQSKFLGFTVLQTLGEFEENIRSAVAYISLAIEVDAVSNRQQSVLSFPLVAESLEAHDQFILAYTSYQTQHI